tara:strand:+ start:294 stop:665 length:372 start_codon:yes stop_codon:yes gene_type:complete
MAFKMRYKNLNEVVKQLRSAVVAHGKQADVIEGHIDDMQSSSPAKGYVSAAQRKAVHANKADGGAGHPDKKRKKKKKKKSPSKMVEASPAKGKLKPCQKAAARKKFDVYPSAYANMWASQHKC